jgi:hypothetical protein
MPRGVKAYVAGSGSLAMLAAMRRASSRVSSFAAARLPYFHFPSVLNRDPPRFGNAAPA